MSGEISSLQFSEFFMHLSARAFTKNSRFADSLCRAWPCSSAQAGPRGSSHVLCKAHFSGQRHAYQNPLGIAITGTLGVLMGLLVLAFGRNLWPVITGHGLFDASRFVLFYFQGPPT